MNSDASCHEIPGCNGLYIDAFKGRYLKKAQNAQAAFILTHYHGDHYGSLPRDDKYTGPAKIHCTPVTAALLCKIHQVPAELVVEHVYGDTWTFVPIGQSYSVDITFYDAHHCPGAAIVLIRMNCDDKKKQKVYLHTGDMRYNPVMKLYPLLRDAVEKNELDTVYLDTTYGAPKHDFVPQHKAVDLVASQVHDILGSHRAEKSDDNTLVLLSCYSIGKEKVLWESAIRTNQKVYVTEKKWRMLECIQSYDNEASNIIAKCTMDACEADIHVIPMGLAGKLWPFFQPDYWAMAKYAEKLEKKYSKVVAFIPTGWALSSNYNKKNAVTSMQCGSVTTEIRLISYSEHSTFSELSEFIDYLRPRKVIPTVYKDAKDKIKIEKRFAIDTMRAKQHFIQSLTSITGDTKSSNESGIVYSEECAKSADKNDMVVPTVLSSATTAAKDDSVTAKRKRCDTDHNVDVEKLVAMGFDNSRATSVLDQTNGNVSEAAALLLKQTSVQKVDASDTLVKPQKKPSGSLLNYFSKRQKSKT